MPKVEYTPSKGLFQTNGNGIELTQGTNLQRTLSIKVYEEDFVATAGTETVLTANAIPAGAIVLGGKITVLTANSNSQNITKVGTTDEDNDDDKYGTCTVAAQTVGASSAIYPTALIPNAAASTVGITAGGSLAADGKFRITLYYLSVA